MRLKVWTKCGEASVWVLCNIRVNMLCCGAWFLFFQAEDGIRVAQESRGLGDVYKRQVHSGPMPQVFVWLVCIIK